MKTNYNIWVALFLLLVSMPAWAAEPDVVRLTVSEAVIEAINSNPMILEATKNMAAAEESVPGRNGVPNRGER